MHGCRIVRAVCDLCFLITPTLAVMSLIMGRARRTRLSATTSACAWPAAIWGVVCLSDRCASAGLCYPPSRNGTPACYEYSWRRATAARGVRECARCGCWALRCSAHNVRRPAWGPRKRTRHHRADRPHAVPRRPAGSERKLTVTAEAYMLFRAGIKPMTEFVNAAGVRATQNRRRAELAVRPKDFEM